MKREGVDLLDQVASTVSDEATVMRRPYTPGIRLNMPWGTFGHRTLYLTSGWYRLNKVPSSTPLSVQLCHLTDYQTLEIDSGADLSTIVRLTAGNYRLSVSAGARPGFYPLEQLHLSRLSVTETLSLLIQRFRQALKTRTSPAKLLGLVAKALRRPQNSYGVRTNTNRGHIFGPLTQSQIPLDKMKLDMDASHRLAHMHRTVCFLIKLPEGQSSTDSGLDQQIYRHFTLETNADHDAVITLGQTERLTPDALLILAEAINRYPEVRRFLMDSLTPDQHLTAHVAWDPVLYACNLPTPYVWRGHVRNMAEAHDLPQQLCRSINLPLAWGKAYVPLTKPAVPDKRPPCSIIIPTRDRADLLQTCLEGLFGNTHWPHEVIIIDNGSIEPATQDLFDRYTPRGLRVIRADIPFNFSTLCNLGAAAAKHEYLVFLNNDIELHRSDWLTQMMLQAMRTDAGAVGARLLYKDNSLQHGGIALGLGQICGHLWRGLSQANQTHEPRLSRASLRSALTGAMLCLSKARFNEVGGFDEVNFGVTLNDVDLCLKLRQAGYLNIFAADATAYHAESETRGPDISPEKLARRKKEMDAFYKKWSLPIHADPWLPDSISRTKETARYK